MSCSVHRVFFSPGLYDSSVVPPRCEAPCFAAVAVHTAGFVCFDIEISHNSTAIPLAMSSERPLIRCPGLTSDSIRAAVVPGIFRIRKSTRARDQTQEYLRTTIYSSISVSTSCSMASSSMASYPLISSGSSRTENLPASSLLSSDG